MKKNTEVSDRERTEMSWNAELNRPRIEKKKNKMRRMLEFPKRMRALKDFFDSSSFLPL